MSSFQKMVLQEALEGTVITESMITEAFDSEPYEFQLEQPRADNVYAVFTDEDGKDFRIQFYSGVGLGKGVRRVRLGMKKGASFSDANITFKNPNRAIATMIAASEEFFKTPIGMKAPGFAFELTRKAAPRGVKIIRAVMKRKMRAKFDVLESTFSPEEGKGFIWVIRKGKKVEDVFNGPKVEGMLVSNTTPDTNPTSSTETQPSKDEMQEEIASILLGHSRKEMTGDISGAYQNTFRLVITRDIIIKASKDGVPIHDDIVMPSNLSARQFANNASIILDELVARFKRGEWDVSYNRWKTQEVTDHIDLFANNLYEELSVDPDDAGKSWYVSDDDGDFEAKVSYANYPQLYITADGINPHQAYNGVEEAANAINDLYDLVTSDEDEDEDEVVAPEPEVTPQPMKNTNVTFVEIGKTYVGFGRHADRGTVIVDDKKKEIGKGLFIYFHKKGEKRQQKLDSKIFIQRYKRA